MRIEDVDWESLPEDYARTLLQFRLVMILREAWRQGYLAEYLAQLIPIVNKAFEKVKP